MCVVVLELWNLLSGVRFINSYLVALCERPWQLASVSMEQHPLRTMHTHGAQRSIAFTFRVVSYRYYSLIQL